ncbi:putative mitochondrial protein [Tanacetum coccineum]
MVNALVLRLPDFLKEFTLEIDASHVGLGGFLLQEGHPIAFLNKTLSAKHQLMSTYKKEFLAIRMSTPTQLKWLPKLMGFDYEIQYKKGVENVTADALSRLQTSSELFIMISSSLTTNRQLAKRFEAKTSSVGGYSGFRTTTSKICSVFYWKQFRRNVKKLVLECDVCQRYKPDLVAYLGLLQPFPTRIWTHISMDFIESLPKSQGKIVIFVVVDRLRKYAHFIPLSHPFTAMDGA